MKVLGFLGSLVAAMLVEGFVLKTLWGWFVVSAFGLAPLLWAQAVGLALTARVFTGTSHIGADQASTLDAVGVKRHWLETGVRAVVFPLVLLAFGWVYRLFL